MTDVRTRILQEALNEFAKYGLANSSLESIAHRADCEPGAVRALFVDKETLLSEVLKERTASMLGAVGIATELAENPKEMIRETLKLFDQWLVDHPQIARVLAHSALEGAPSIKFLYEHTLLPSSFFERLEESIDRGELRCKNLFTASMLLDSLVFFPHIMRSFVEQMSPGKSADEVFEARLSAVIDLLENGLYSE